MKVIIQRVSSASVSVKGDVVGQIKQGLLLFIGITHQDSLKNVEWLTHKISNLRIFSDINDKLNLSIQDIHGEILAVSQFTLYADAIKGNRPSFAEAAISAQAMPLYEAFIAALRAKGIKTATGIFATDMQVQLINDGPVTIVLEK